MLSRFDGTQWWRFSCRFAWDGFLQAIPTYYQYLWQLYHINKKKIMSIVRGQRTWQNPWWLCNSSRSNLIGQLVATHSNSMCEELVLKVKTLSLLVIYVYSPPNCTTDNLREALETCQVTINDVCEKVNKIKDILKFGDYNLPCISWPSSQLYTRVISNMSQEKLQAELLVNYMNENILENVIHTATWERTQRNCL